MDYSLFFEKFFMPLIAAFIGALLAFIYQKRTQKYQDKKYVLATLMAYRHLGPDEPEFVKALNMTDIIYHDNFRVKELLHKYLKFTSSEFYSGSQRVEVFFDMLVEMGRDIGYPKLKHSDITEFYVPLPVNSTEPTKTDTPTTK